MWLGASPPSSAATTSGDTSAAAKIGIPSTSSAAALPAARTAAQPDASKPVATTRSPSTCTEMRTRSPHAAPPAAPVCGASASAPKP